MRHNVNVNVIRPQLKIYEFSIFGNGHTTQYMPNMYNIGLASNEFVCVCGIFVVNNEKTTRPLKNPT